MTETKEFTKQNVFDVEYHIGKLLDEKAQYSLRKKEFEIELAEIRNKIRGNRLPNKEYKQLCDRQTAIKTVLMPIETELARIASELRKKHTLADEIKNHLKIENDLKPQTYQMIACECGHTVPIDYATDNVCMPCIISDLKQELKSVKRKLKTTNL